MATSIWFASFSQSRQGRALLCYLFSGLCFILSGSVFAQKEVKGVSISGGDNSLKIQLEAETGVYGGTSFGESGNHVQIQLRDTSPEALKSLLSSLSLEHPLISRVDIASDEQGLQYLVLTLRQTATLSEESLNINADGISRWDVLLSAKPEATASEAKPIPFNAIRANWQRGALDLTFLGGDELIAEVSYDAQGRGLLIDLPDVSESSVEEALNAFNARKAMPLISAIRQIEGPAGMVRLLLESDSAVDLVDSSAEVSPATGQGQVQITLVTDSPAQPTLPGEVVEGNQQVLDSIAVITGDDSIGVMLSGQLPESIKVNSYVLEQPNRLMVDLLGLSDDQVVEAVSRFQSVIGVKGIRYGDTRQGSARIELELDPGLELASSALAVQVQPQEGGLLVSTPVMVGSGGLLAGIPGSSHLDLSYRPEHDFARTPQLVIQPVTLAGWSDEIPANIEMEAEATEVEAVSQTGQEFDLLSLYRTALKSDAKYQVVLAEFDVSAEAEPQALADYLPQVSASYQFAEAKRRIIENPSLSHGRYDVPTQNWELKITQPLYRRQPLVKMEQAKISVEQARLGMLIAEQDLILRVATGYLNVLAARDALELIMAEKDATESQYKLAQENMERGLGTMTELNDTLSRYALNQAREIEAQDRLEEARLALKEIIGTRVVGVRTFQGDFETTAPVPAEPDAWVNAALQQNLALQTRDMAVEIAALEITRQKAAHHPTLDLEGSYGHNKTKSLIVRGADDESETFQVAVTLNVPIYSGGRTSSLVRESEAQMRKTRLEQEDEQRLVERIVRSTFMRVQNTTLTLKALRQVVSAQEGALQARVKGVEAGLFNMIDVLDAQRQYYTARRDYLQARYDYLVDRLKLKQSVGTLSRADLEDLDALLN